MSKLGTKKAKVRFESLQEVINFANDNQAYWVCLDSSDGKEYLFINVGGQTETGYDNYFSSAIIIQHGTKGLTGEFYYCENGKTFAECVLSYLTDGIAVQETSKLKLSNSLPVHRVNEVLKLPERIAYVFREEEKPIKLPDKLNRDKFNEACNAANNMVRNYPYYQQQFTVPSYQNQMPQQSINPWAGTNYGTWHTADNSNNGDLTSIIRNIMNIHSITEFKHWYDPKSNINDLFVHGNGISEMFVPGATLSDKMHNLCSDESITGGIDDSIKDLISLNKLYSFAINGSGGSVMYALHLLIDGHIITITSGVNEQFNTFKARCLLVAKD